MQIVLFEEVGNGPCQEITLVLPRDHLERQVPHNKLPIGVYKSGRCPNKSKTITFGRPNIVDECETGVKILGVE